MKQIVQIQVLPSQLEHTDLILKLAHEKNNSSMDDFPFFYIEKRSIDARKKPVKYNLKVILMTKNNPPQLPIVVYKTVDKNQKIHIIGAGPAGLFAALEAIELGFQPVIFERGKNVRERRRDLANLNKEHLVHPDSNYCFGEGGAGTYSDGKLYTRSKKRGNTLKILELLVQFGAPADILVNAHPHIGTNKLPKIIEKIRKCILEAGGEIHFEQKVTDFIINDQKITALEINGRGKVPVENVILATGHSARDIFDLLHQKGIKIQAKNFALGVRIEHPRPLIDHIQYHGEDNEDLPAATYSLVTQTKYGGVYSFCMCPGGIVAPCATQQEEVVTNGWSPSKRDSPYSNSGIVVEIDVSKLSKNVERNPFVGLNFQKKVEHDCWVAAGKTQTVPAQRLTDFLVGKVSEDLPKTSYLPGLASVDLNKILPDFVAKALKMAFLDFGKKMKGFLTDEAVLHAPESRTSSPISIPRNATTLQHVEIENLYPCGEGAGYAGGIASAAVDGMNCVQAIERNKKYSEI